MNSFRKKKSATTRPRQIGVNRRGTLLSKEKKNGLIQEQEEKKNNSCGTGVGDEVILLHLPSKELLGLGKRLYQGPAHTYCERKRGFGRRSCSQRVAQQANLIFKATPNTEDGEIYIHPPEKVPRERKANQRIKASEQIKRAKKKREEAKRRNSPLILGA